jgi:hypothetical protein
MASAVMGVSSCSLEEYNPSGYTMDALSASEDGYQTILNNIYFGMERSMYGYGQFMLQTEGGTDTWTSQKNADNTWLKYGNGSDFANNMMLNFLNTSYDGICYCNQAIVYADKVPFASEEERNQKVAEAYFMRAMYYFGLVEQFGGVTLHMKPAENVDTHPSKNDPLEIYEQCIIPDLEFAVKWLPVEDRTTRPSKKSAMALLAKACLQTVEYDSSKKYVARALEVAKEMINDCNAGGASLGVYMYDNINDVFDESNNFENKEALWKHRYVVGGVSNNAWYMNQNNEYFYCPLTAFSAFQFNTTAHSGNKYAGLTDYQIADRRAGGSFMPSKYLLDLYVQDDGTLDPRYHAFFQTAWTCNKDKGQSWSESMAKLYDKDIESTEISNVTVDATTGNESRVYTKYVFDEPAMEFIRPGDEDYDKKVAQKRTSKILYVDYADVYADDNTVKMYYTRVNDGSEVVNPWINFYPSLVKHNSSNYYINNLSKKRLGNLNATFMMRTPEVFFIAAEADIYLNGGANALQYLNAVRKRAGAKELTGTATVETVLDERARELCGEYQRFYDLKRTGKLTHNYLNSTNPDVGKYFVDGKHEVRPFPQSFLENLEEGGIYYQNPGY